MADNLCKSCGYSISEEFCGRCGEKSSNKRLTVKDVFADFLSNTLDLEYPLLRTIKGLTLKPGVVCREYIEGKRKPYYKPFQYYLLTLAVFFLVFYASDLKMSDYMSAFDSEFLRERFGEGVEEMEKNLANVTNAYSRLLMFSLIPITSFFSWLLFRKSGYNMTENFVMNLYLSAHGTLIGLIGIPLSLISFTVYLAVTGVGSLAYELWGFKQFFQVKTGTVLARGILVLILASATLALLNLSIAYVIMHLFGDRVSI